LTNSLYEIFFKLPSNLKTEREFRPSDVADTSE